MDTASVTAQLAEAEAAGRVDVHNHGG